MKNKTKSSSFDRAVFRKNNFPFILETNFERFFPKVEAIF